jgi:mono/diheme cytochrome c family protein
LLHATMTPWTARAQPSALVVRGLSIEAPGVDPGEILLGELNCLACHAASATVQARLTSKPGPLLGEAAQRLRPDHLRAILRDPVAAKPGTTMPALLPGLTDTEREDTVEALAQFLSSLAKPQPAAPKPSSHGDVEQGRSLYHRVGCVACHPALEPAFALYWRSAAPTDPATAAFVLRQLDQTSVPLGNLAAKFAPGELARFLLDPLHARPGGRMPSSNLTAAEAGAMAAYLESVHAGTNAPAAAPAPVSTSGVDAAKARHGGELFASLGCAACHELGPNQPRVSSTLKAKSFADLDPVAPGGCLASIPAPGVPHYQFNEAQRVALRTTLADRARLDRPQTAAERVTATLTRLDCVACHARDGYGGPSPSRADYFATLGDADLGDEGRLPPHLSGVGRKLRSSWLREVLTRHGAERPYLATRMPQFGASNVLHLVAAFQTADVPPLPAGPVIAGSAEMGRRLVGTNGCSCLTCHRWNGRPSLTISVMDLTQMAKQLRPEWFRQYLLEPTALRPGTRMPGFWPDGKATVRTMLDGDTERQIRSIWLYLLHSVQAPPPAGLSPPERVDPP